MNKPISIIASGILLAAAAMPAFGADCSAPAGFIEAKACAAARNGIDALRQFASRTRMIYGIHLPDYAKALPAEELWSAEDEGAPAVLPADRSSGKDRPESGR